MIQRKLAAIATRTTTPTTIVLFDHRPLCSGGGSDGSERRLKPVNSGRTGPSKSPGTATITAEPAKPNSASATARVERLLAPVVTSSTSSIHRDCGFQGGANAFEFRFEIVKQLGDAQQFAGGAETLDPGADLCHLNCSHVTGASFEHVGRLLRLLGLSPLDRLPQLIQP